MDILFRTSKLAKQCCDDSQARKAFGDVRAKRLRVRLDDLDAVDNLAEARNLPGRFHELKGDMAGKFTLDLEGPYRLIFEPVTPGDLDRSDLGDWSKITCVMILGIEDTHG